MSRARVNTADILQWTVERIAVAFRIPTSQRAKRPWFRVKTALRAVAELERREHEQAQRRTNMRRLLRPRRTAASSRKTVVSGATETIPDDLIDLFEDVTSEDLFAEIDRESRRRLGMSGAEFARKYRQHELPDTLAVNELGILLNCVEESVIPA